MSTPEDDLRADEDIEADDATASFIRRAPRISQADVFRAADELLIEGHRPTIDRVRMRLGREFPNTINDHMDTWWTKLGSRLRDLPGGTFPQLPERVGQALQLLWNEALEGAHETLQSALLEREEAITQQDQALQARARLWFGSNSQQRTNGQKTSKRRSEPGTPNVFTCATGSRH